MNRTEKEALVASVNATLETAGLVVVTRQSGMTVAEAGELRAQMRAAGAQHQVVKNRLAKIALKGTSYEGLSDLFAGPTAISFSEDPVAAAKVIVKFAEKNDKLEVLGGGLGTQVLDTKAVEALAKLPSLDELRGKLIGVISAPATKVARTVQAPASQLARVFGAYSQKSDVA